MSVGTEATLTGCRYFSNTVFKYTVKPRKISARTAGVPVLIRIWNLPNKSPVLYLYTVLLTEHVLIDAIFQHAVI
jgi:hypothetical protein